MKKTGDRVRKGDTVFRVFANDERRMDEALERLRGAFTVGDEPVERRPLVFEVIER